MNLGLRDAEALSRVLADALRSQDDSSLEAYAQARREKAKQILAMTERLTYVATLRSPVSCWLRNRLIAVVDCLPGVKRGIARTLAGFS
jgi:2-polyprenyl-6-methoxyphenol hydroxylase-like FAD-dependent oxidoreductase